MKNKKWLAGWLWVVMGFVFVFAYSVSAEVIQFKEIEEDETIADEMDPVEAGEYEALFYHAAEEDGITDPADVEYRVGRAFLGLGNQWRYAEMHFRSAVEKDPKHALAWFVLGMLYMGSDEGNGYIKKAIESDPELAEGYYWLGYNHIRAGKDDEGKKYFEQYLKIVTGRPEEAGRVLVAKEVLADLQAGTSGENLAKIRRGA